MGQSKYKNIIKLRRTPDPIEERENLHKEVLKDSTILPNTLVLKDIDIAFKEWVEKDLSIAYEDKELPTITLFSSQRFSEYMQSWENNDDRKNLIMNFKVVTRENNPQPGTLHDKNMNIPGERTYLMKRALMEDKNGRPYFLDYRMKQPYCVDLIYTVSVVTNKYELLNEFNMMLNDKFKAFQCYIRPNGHFLPMKLENISDESEYSMDDRQYFSQSFEIRVMAYIINENDMMAVECPIVKLLGCMDSGDKRNSAYVEIEEEDPCYDPQVDSPYYYQPVTLNAYFKDCEREVEFTIDRNFVIVDVDTENIISYIMTVNDTKVNPSDSGATLTSGAVVKLNKVNRRNMREEGKIVFKGYNPDVVFDERLDNPESELDRTQFYETIDVANSQE